MGHRGLLYVQEAFQQGYIQSSTLLASLEICFVEKEGSGLSPCIDASPFHIRAAPLHPHIQETGLVQHIQLGAHLRR